MTVQPFTKKELKKFWEAKLPIRMSAFISLGVTTGYRVTELLSLRVGDVCHYQKNKKGKQNLVINGMVTVEKKNTKGKKSSRTIQLNTTTRDFLYRYITTKNLDLKGFLFPGKGVKALCRQHIYRLMRSTSELVLGTCLHIGTHTLRKTFACLVYDKSKDILLVMRKLGHYQIGSTMRYLNDFDTFGEQLELQLI